MTVCSFVYLFVEAFVRFFAFLFVCSFVRSFVLFCFVCVSVLLLFVWGWFLVVVFFFFWGGGGVFVNLLVCLVACLLT